MNSADKEALSVFLPFYNEEQLVEQAVENCQDYLSGLDREYELLLVDDGSTDATAGKVDELAARYKKVRAIHHEENEGYGRALATGFSETRHPLVFYTDGDMQFDISQLDGFLYHIEEHDLVVGYRENREDGLSRIVMARAFNFLTRLLLPVEVRDVDCAFKLVRREVLEEIELETERTVDAELLAKASSKGYSIKELGVEHRERPAGESEAEGLLGGIRISLAAKSVYELLDISRDLE